MKRLSVLLLTLFLSLTGLTGCSSDFQHTYLQQNIKQMRIEESGPHREIKKVIPNSDDKKAAQSNFKTYEGPIEHIFFHPLIAYPELAFDHDSLAKGYNDYFVTVNEFRRILNELYQNDYILIDIHSLFEVREDETIVRKELKLPQGKKPLILSIDDMNYYDYMRENGNVYKLILDEKGNVASYSVAPDGKEVTSYGQAIVPILDRFVADHPDFSFQGAKGLIALTGYQGVLGYHTNESDEHEKEEALKVIKRLKETGWTFASHGYGHLDAAKVSYERLVADTTRWKDEVEPLVGTTRIYVYPYGSRVETGSEKFDYLINSGFKVLCSIGPRPFLDDHNRQVMMMDRRHIDGISLQTQQEQLATLLDADNVLEKAVRPPLK